jgi:hypothetical protein
MRLGRKNSKQRELRIYFATDLHGSEVCFRKFLAAAKVYEADVIILGGDFAGKAIVPVLTEDGMLRAEAHGEDVTVPESQWDRLAGAARSRDRHRPGRDLPGLPADHRMSGGQRGWSRRSRTS